MSAKTHRTPETPLGAAERRLIDIVARMPLASAANLVPILAMSERQVLTMLRRLQRAGWLESMSVGMIEQRQQRWFLTSRAARSFYANDDVDPTATDVDERLPWTATARGVRVCLRRLAALEMLYRIAPALVRSGWLYAPRSGDADRLELDMTDIRLLRNGGWYHAVAHYGPDCWATFTYVGVHSTERSLRRKRAHRFWGLDVYTSHEDEHERVADRFFYEDPKHEATPSAQVVLAADSWAAQLAQREFAHRARPLICTPDGRWNDPVELHHSSDRVSDPVRQLQIGKVEHPARWRVDNLDLIAACDPLAYALLMAIAQFPAMQRDDLRHLVNATSAAVHESLTQLAVAGLVDASEGHCYLAERGLRRAANLNRILAGSLIRRHGAYLHPSFRDMQLRHDEGLNRLVVQFATEGAAVFAGWRGEINLPNITQIKPDLLIQVTEGPLGAGPHCVEFERAATQPNEVTRKLGPYRRCAAAGRPIPVLVVCETERAAGHFLEHDALMPMLVTHVAAIDAGRLTGDETVWRRRGVEVVSLHCRP